MFAAFLLCVATCGMCLLIVAAPVVLVAKAVDVALYLFTGV